MADRLNTGVVAVVVTYLPDLDALHALLTTLSLQVDAVVLVDNGSGDALLRWLRGQHPGHLTPFLLDHNIGLAAAQNMGIREARRLCAEFVLLSDQDSLPAPDMVSRLLSVTREKLAAGCRLAAVGPRYFDVLQNSVRPFVRLRGFRVERFDCSTAGQVFEVDHLIASGCLIPIAALDEIGDMNEGLFIDYIDTEWCLRAWRNGFLLFGAGDATMRHSLGEKPNRFLGRYIPVQSPLRNYYLFRNAIWLMRRDWLPLPWKLATIRRLLLLFVYFLVFGSNRRSRAKMMLAGLWHGIMNRLGAYPG